jgi:hypothetical protein
MRIGVLRFFTAGILASAILAFDVSGSEPPQITGKSISNEVTPALILTDEQKAQIRSEEIYRSQVRQELDAKNDQNQSSTDRLWSVLNSSFVLWLLSSVVLSGLAACYTAWQNHHAKARANQESVDKLDTEISNRIYEALSATRSYEGSIKNNVVWQPKEYYSLMFSFLNNHFNSTQGETYSDFSIFPEFKECGFRSLVTMLYDALHSAGKNKDETLAFKEIIVVFESFANRGSIPDNNPDMSKENLLRVILEIREVINTRLLIKRWRKDDLY